MSRATLLLFLLSALVLIFMAHDVGFNAGIETGIAQQQKVDEDIASQMRTMHVCEWAEKAKEIYHCEDKP